MKKYIVDNLSSQSIDGQLTINGGLTASDVEINGNLVVSGLTASDAKIDNLVTSGATINGDLLVNGNLTIGGTYSTKTYRALLTQSGYSATNLDALDGAFIIGETYTVTDYKEGDDFDNLRNIADSINATGSVFVATGEIPNVWTNGSQITSGGGLIATVLENTLGYDLYWDITMPGVYRGSRYGLGDKYNEFPRNRTSITVQDKNMSIIGDIRLYATIQSSSSKDDSVEVVAWDYDMASAVSGAMYYTAVEIKTIQNNDTTPVTISGTVSNEYPFYPTVRLFCNGNVIEYFSANGVEVNNLTELLAHLNDGEVQTSFLGVFSDDGSGGIHLVMPANLVERFNPYGTLTFDVYWD